MMAKDNHLQATTPREMGVPVRYSFLVLLALQYSGFILLLHYSRVMPVVGGRRYLTSTAVFLNEVLKLAVCLTVALYDVSKTAPVSMPATSLFSSLSSAIFSGDSWKLAIPAVLYTAGNSLLYIGVSNLDAATFQVTYQLKLIAASVFGAVVFRRNLTFAKWMSLLLLIVGVAIVQWPVSDPYDLETRAHLHAPRSLKEWKDLGGNNLHKRSATYEGIEEDLMLGNPHLNGKIGLSATVGACIASGLGGVSFEKVLKDSSNVTSIWIRNVQLAIYSIFPALFIGVVFLDGEEVAKVGFFEGYNWVVGATIGIHAIGGIATSFCINSAETTLKSSAGVLSIILSTVASVFLLEFEIGASFFLGTTVVLVATYAYIQSTPPDSSRHRPPPIRIENFEKASYSPDTDTAGDDIVSPPNDFSIKLPTTPLMAEEARSTSRPGSPSLQRNTPSRSSSYFASQRRET